MINEVLDINNAVKYTRSKDVEIPVKKVVKGISGLRGYSFKVKDIVYGCFHFKRNNKIELHFYDGTNVTSIKPLDTVKKAPFVVYVTVFKILLDYLQQKAGSDILIAFDKSKKNVYKKLITQSFKKYNLISDNYILEDKFEIIKTPENEDAFLIKSKMKGLRECIVDLK